VNIVGVSADLLSPARLLFLFLYAIRMSELVYHQSGSTPIGVGMGERKNTNWCGMEDREYINWCGDGGQGVYQLVW
jgi:hypothetical protein